jgi:hypothetical protein
VGRWGYIVISHGNSITESRFFGGLLEILGQDLSSLVEVIAPANVDEDIGLGTFVFLDEFGGIMLRPFGLVIRSKVARKCLASKLVSQNLAGKCEPFHPRGNSWGLRWGRRRSHFCTFPGCAKTKSTLRDHLPLSTN